MVQQSHFRRLTQALLIFGFSLFLVSCTVGGQPKSDPYVALVSDGFLGKTWEYTDDEGKTHPMKRCAEKREFWSKSCVESRDKSVRFEWYSWRDSVKAPVLTIANESHGVTCDRGPLDLQQLKCKTGS